jgi:predicted dienelactone hydrolase
VRPLEWLFFLSFLPIFCFFVAPGLKQRRSAFMLAAMLPVGSGLLHIVVEGWRAQMLVLYFLAVLIALSTPITLRRSGAVRRAGLLVSSATALLFVIGGVVPGWLLPIASLPAPTGPYRVGIVDRELLDAARDRRLMVSIWYPTAQTTVPAPLLQHADAVTKGLAASFGVPMAAPLLEHLRYFRLAASTGVSILQQPTPFPVLVFSHGLVGIRSQNSTLFQELTSWGYIVVALDHTDAAAVTVFPNGETRLFNLQRFSIQPDGPVRSTEILLPIWVADQRFVYDTLQRWAIEDDLLAGKLDLKHIASFGHSFGGATALEVCRIDSRCRAAVNLDGGMTSTGASKPAVRPVMLISSSDSNQFASTMQRWTQLISTSTAPAYWIELLGGDHYSLTIVPLLSPLLAPRVFDVRAGLRTVDKYTRTFFDLHLRGIKTQLLRPTSVAAEVRWHSK